MTFTPSQIEALRAPLDPKHVAQRQQSGQRLSYIEGWHAIAEANRIFGFDGWTRETVEVRQVAEYERKIGQQQKPGWSVTYTARVRITVGAIVREGTGAGHGVGTDLGDCHESAIKEAETDAMKRALMTFGNPFGLALYDKTQANVRAPGPDPTTKIDDATRDTILDTLAKRKLEAVDLCGHIGVSSLKDLTYGNLPAVREWVQNPTKKEG